MGSGNEEIAGTANPNISDISLWLVHDDAVTIGETRVRTIILDSNIGEPCRKLEVRGYRGGGYSTRRLLDLETHREVPNWVLCMLADRGLLNGKRIAIDEIVRTVVRGSAGNRCLYADRERLC